MFFTDCIKDVPCYKLPTQAPAIMDIVPNFLELISGTPNKTTTTPTHHTPT